jgi:hypothetical protein
MPSIDLPHCERQKIVGLKRRCRHLRITKQVLALAGIWQNASSDFCVTKLSAFAYRF